MNGKNGFGINAVRNNVLKVHNTATRYRARDIEQNDFHEYIIQLWSFNWGVTVI